MTNIFHRTVTLERAVASAVGENYFDNWLDKLPALKPETYLFYLGFLVNSKSNNIVKLRMQLISHDLKAQS